MLILTRRCNVPVHWTLWVAFSLFAPSATAAAQDTGGSFGGGDFGGGDNGGGDYSGGSSSDGSGGGGGWSREPPTLDDLLFGAQLYTVAGVIGAISIVFWGGLAWLVVLLQLERAVRRRRPFTYPFAVDLTALTLALDWRARPAVQARLATLATQVRADTREGRARLTAETARLLWASRPSWLYAGVRCMKPASPKEIESTFRQSAIDARARFKVETVRQLEGHVVEQAAPDVRARAHEGPGVVVVTLLVAARQTLRDVRDPSDPGELEMALWELATVAKVHAVAALEVIWSPAEDADRMSTAELEALYPELRPVAEAPRFGLVYCAHCLGPYAGELSRCPHCGAAERSEERRWK